MAKLAKIFFQPSICTLLISLLLYSIPDVCEAAHIGTNLKRDWIDKGLDIVHGNTDKNVDVSGSFFGKDFDVGVGVQYTEEERSEFLFYFILSLVTTVLLTCLCCCRICNRSR